MLTTRERTTQWATLDARRAATRSGYDNTNTNTNTEYTCDTVSIQMKFAFKISVQLWSRRDSSVVPLP